MSEITRYSDIENNQANLWRQQAQPAVPQVLKKQAINDSTWTLLHTVPEGAFTQLQEILIYNGDSATVTWRLALTGPSDSDPSGSTIDEPNVFQSGSTSTGNSAMVEMATGLFKGWKVWFWSDAASGKNFNVCLTGLVLTFQ